MAKDEITIGGASGYWGDAASATPQLLDAEPDVIVYDYLAEITMGILARARDKDPRAGYATDFITAAMIPNLERIAAQGTRIISNAGGVNPLACADALRKAIADAGLTLRVACVTGDDMMPELAALAERKPNEMFTGASFPEVEKIQSANAYLGAFPIARALGRGADIVITGRCVDSAVTLGACIHAFDWSADDLDPLAGAALAGHILECGTQATGGNFTDWQGIQDTLHDCGYPLASIARDGTFDLFKPVATGGAVTPGTVAEQMLYEIGDPAAYVLPDVICDFTGVLIEATGHERVHVSGARGRGVPADFKLCATYHDGWRIGHYFSFYGADAEAAARCFADASLHRARRAMVAAKMADFEEVSVELIGAESQWGAARQMPPAREVALKLAARHNDPRALGLLMREATGMALAGPPGLSGFAGTRPRPSPVMALWSGLVPKSGVTIRVGDEAGTETMPPALPPRLTPAVAQTPPPLPTGDTRAVELRSIALARSGDKGNIANIGVIARDPVFLPVLWHGIDATLLSRVFGHFWQGTFDKFLLPGTSAVNILLHEALGGGGVSSLRNDPQAKGFAQLLLAAEIAVPVALLASPGAIFRSPPSENAK